MLLNAYTRLFSRWAKHSTYGIAALLELVPRNSGDAAIGEITVVDDVDDEGVVALDYRPPYQRTVIVCVDNDGVASPDKGRGEEELDRIVVGIYYMVKDLSITKARQEGEYVLEAAAMNHRLLNKRAFIEARVGAPTTPAGTTDPHYREYAGVSVDEIVPSLVAMRLTPGPGSDNYVGALFVTWKGARVPFTVPGV